MRAGFSEGEGGRPRRPTPWRRSEELGGRAAGGEGVTRSSITSSLSHREGPLIANTDVPRAGEVPRAPTPLPPSCCDGPSTGTSLAVESTTARPRVRPSSTGGWVTRGSDTPSSQLTPTASCPRFETNRSERGTDACRFEMGQRRSSLTSGDGLEGGGASLPFPEPPTLRSLREGE
jgi:hypothetical protein